jgi:hypothetical protein
VGDVVAEELTVSGHVKGTIRANRVKVNSTGIVEGDHDIRGAYLTLDATKNSQTPMADNLPEDRRWLPDFPLRRHDDSIVM